MLAIDVSGDNLYAAVGTYASGIVKVEKLLTAKLPPAAVEDGIIKNRAAFETALGNLTAGGLRQKAAAVTFNSSSMLSRRMELPLSKPREIAMMVKNEMLQAGGSAGDYAYEYTVIRDTNPPDAKTLWVWGYALPRGTVDGYSAALKARNLRPAALDYHGNSVEKLFLGGAVNGSELGSRSALFVCAEEEFIEIHLFSDGLRAFTRTAPLSASEMRLIFKSAGIGSDNGDFAEHLDITSDRVREDPILNDAVHQYINGLADELQKMVQFQLRRDSSNPVQAVYLFGSLAAIVGMDQGLSAALGVRAETIRSLSRVKTAEPSVLRHINAIGSLIRL